MEKWHEKVRNAVTGVPYVASVATMQDHEYANIAIDRNATIDDLPRLVDEVRTNLDDLNVPHQIVSYLFTIHTLVVRKQEVTPRDVMLAYLRERYKDDDSYVESYIEEAEHQDGKSFWRMFDGPQDLYTDFELYRANADLLGKATPGVTK